MKESNLLNLVHFDVVIQITANDMNEGGIPGNFSRSCRVVGVQYHSTLLCQSGRLKKNGAGGGESAKTRGREGCSDRMGRLRRLGEQRAGRRDRGEKEEEREQDGRQGRGWLSVWDRLSLEGNQSSQGFKHTYMQTTTRRALTPLNLICLSFF